MSDLEQSDNYELKPNEVWAVSWEACVRKAEKGEKITFTPVAMQHLDAGIRDLKALLAEKDAEIFQLQQLNSESAAALESLKDRAELADLIIKTWMELQYIEASDARKRKLKSDTIEYFGGGFLETGGAYDALSGPREGEQDATVPKTVSSA